MHHVKIVVVGDNSCNKTLLLHLYRYNQVASELEYIPTVFDNYTESRTVNNKHVEVGLWDTSGQENYDRLRPQSYPGTNTFIVCFHIGIPSTYENVSKFWIPEVKHHVPEAKIVLLGVEPHVREDEEYVQRLASVSQHCITPEEGRLLQKRIGAQKYIEASTVTGQGLKEVFDAAIMVNFTSDDIVKQQQRKSRFRGLFSSRQDASEVDDAIAAATGKSSTSFFNDTEISLPNRNISTLPIRSKALLKLSQITTVELYNNNFTSIPEALFSLPNLTSLDMSTNKISAIPVAIKNAPQLKSLSLHENRIVSLPYEMSKLKNLTFLTLKGNLLRHPFDGIVTRYASNRAFVNSSLTQEGIDKLMQLLHDLKFTVKQNRVKLYVVGHGHAGKSTLLQSLRQRRSLLQFLSSSSTKPELERTVGIEMVSLKLNNAEVVVWDFGGQMQFYATHEFFLTSESTIYVLVADLSKDIDRDRNLDIFEAEVRYWLSFAKAKLQPGQYSKLYLFLVGSHVDVCQQYGDTIDIDSLVTQRLSRFLNNVKIQKSFAIDCRENSQVDQVKNAITETVDAITGDVYIPKFYKNLIEALPKFSKLLDNKPVVDKNELQYLVSSDWRKLCPDPEMAFDVGLFERGLQFLNEIGEVIYFANHPQLSDIVILDPEWLCKDIFGAIFCPREFRKKGFKHDHGRVSHRELSRFFNTDGSTDSSSTSANKKNTNAVISIEKLLSILERFELCYLVENGVSEFPSLMDTTKPTDVWLPSAFYSMNTGRRYICEDEADLFPEGFFPRLQVNLYSEVQVQSKVIMWKGGLTFCRDGVELLVQLNNDKRSLDILARPAMQNTPTSDSSNRLLFRQQPATSSSSQASGSISYFAQITWLQDIVFKMLQHYEGLWRYVEETGRQEPKLKTLAISSECLRDYSSYVSLETTDSMATYELSELTEAIQTGQVSIACKKTNRIMSAWEMLYGIDFAEVPPSNAWPKRPSATQHVGYLITIHSITTDDMLALFSSLQLMLTNELISQVSDLLIWYKGARFRSESSDIEILLQVKGKSLEIIGRDDYINPQNIIKVISNVIWQAILRILQQPHLRRHYELMGDMTNNEFEMLTSESESFVNRSGSKQRPMQVITLSAEECVQTNVSWSRTRTDMDITFTRQIGRGGFGVVYMGVFEGQIVAIKKLISQDLDDDDDDSNNNGEMSEELREFLQEVEVMRSLSHPNIVKLLAASTKRGDLFMVLEYMAKGTLKKLLQINSSTKKTAKMALTWDLKLRFVHDMASGIAFLHERNIMHRDIKSENFLLDDDLRVKVADFGLSRVKNHTLTRTQGLKGSYEYMPPEIVRQEPIGFYSDVFSFAIVMWEVLTCKTLFPEFHKAGTMALIPTKIAEGLRPPIPEEFEAPTTTANETTPTSPSAPASISATNASAIEPSDSSSDVPSADIESTPLATENDTETTTSTLSSEQQRELESQRLYVKLMRDCWHDQGMRRPLFPQIIERIEECQRVLRGE